MPKRPKVITEEQLIAAAEHLSVEEKEEMCREIERGLDSQES